jgi:DNA-binding CsgD family transcriptional regulator
VQRNLVLEKREIARWHDPRTSPVLREMLPRLGVADDDQLRVLVCDGPSLLAWVGAFQPARFDARQKRLLKRLVPALRRRLTVERAVATGPRLRAALNAALEAIGTAAFVLNAWGGVVEVNEAGRLLLAADRAGTLEALRESARRPSASSAYDVSVISSPGMPDERLAVARRPARAHVEPRAASAAARWSLTRRQGEVLALVAQGLPNRTIAATLGIAEGTVEVHLTAIFEKVGVRNRSALVARIWES